MVELPEGLADLPPGRRLARLLSTLDPTRLNGWQLVTVLEAQNRQLAHDQARMLAVARELAYTPPCGIDSPPQRQAEANPYVGSEISFALTWTEYAGGALADVALDCLDRLPDLHAAMLAGRADLPKVRLIVTELAQADDEHARRVVTALLPELHRATTTQLRAMLRRHLLRLDPDAVRKRHARAVADRAVAHFEFTATNTAAVSASNLPIATAAAAYNHLDAVARATKSAGDPRTLDQIRADVFTDQAGQHVRVHDETRQYVLDAHHSPPMKSTRIRLNSSGRSMLAAWPHWSMTVAVTFGLRWAQTVACSHGQ